MFVFCSDDKEIWKGKSGNIWSLSLREENNIINSGKKWKMVEMNVGNVCLTGRKKIRWCNWKKRGRNVGNRCFRERRKIQWWKLEKKEWKEMQEMYVLGKEGKYSDGNGKKEWKEM